MTYVNNPTFEALRERVIQWAHDKGIFESGTDVGQATKILEESVELFSAVAVGNEAETRDAIGDVLVTVIIMQERTGESGTFDLNVRKEDVFVSSWQYAYDATVNASNYLANCLATGGGMIYSLFDVAAMTTKVAISLEHDPLECLEEALNEIEGRAGEMVDGVFKRN